eukprot:1157568-Pelagomonas_calceolata.AAC.8
MQGWRAGGRRQRGDGVGGGVRHQLLLGAATAVTGAPGGGERGEGGEPSAAAAAAGLDVLLD